MDGLRQGSSAQRLGGIPSGSMQFFNPLPNTPLCYTPIAVPYVLSPGPQPFLHFSPLSYQPLLSRANPPSQTLAESAPVFGSSAAPPWTPTWGRAHGATADGGRKTQGRELGNDRKVDRAEDKK